jgi:hypothetical protein
VALCGKANGSGFWRARSWRPSSQRARIGPALAAVAAAADPDARARELAVELLPQLPLLPLVTRGVGVSAARDVQHLTRDALGLPRLDDAFLAPE